MDGVLCSAKLESPIFEAFSNTVDGQYIYICDMKTKVWRWSKEAVDYFGLPDEYVYDFTNLWIKLVHPDDRERVELQYNRVFSGEISKYSCEYRIKNSNDEYVWIVCNGSMIGDEFGEKDLTAGLITKLGQKNKFDPITGLYSVYEFEKAVEKIAENICTPCGIMMFSIDYFRKINEAYDYEIGNKLLFRFAKKLMIFVPKEGVLYRINGDQFALWCPNADDSTLNWFFNQILILGKEGIKIDEWVISFTVTAGAIVYSNNECACEELYSSLEYTFDYAQKSNRGQLTMFSKNLYAETLYRSGIQQRLRECVRNNFKGFYLCYQPLIAMEEEIDPIGAEALLRWEDAVYGLVPPSEFIPLLEETRDIDIVGRWVLSEALCQVRKWHKYKPYMKISVNVSLLQFRDKSFKQFVLNEVEKYNFPKNQLILELTESCDVLYPAEVESQLSFFRERGIQIALDDFGTGYASLSTLRDLSADWIKVDHSFVGQITHNSFDMALTETLITLCKRLGMRVCVEGIETQEIEEIIKKYNPNVMQGYYYSKPIKAEEFEARYLN